MQLLQRIFLIAPLRRLVLRANPIPPIRDACKDPYHFDPPPAVY
jgi:hypothetical protein